MNREDVEEIGLGEPEARDSATGYPVNFPLIGLPEHLEAKIVGRDEYELKRKGDISPYRQNQTSRTPEAALQALKGLLNWDPV